MQKKGLFLIRLLIIWIIAIILCFEFDPIYSLDSYSSYEKLVILDDKDDPILQVNNGYKKITPVTNDAIPTLLEETVIHFEDKRFYHHSGFDFYRIVKTIFANFWHKQKQGASTISQQYIKNTYLSNTKSMTRKTKELFLSIKLEKNTPKKTIFKEYLNSIYYGSGNYGIVNACRFYFDKEPLELNANEIALIYALIKAPNEYHPINNADKSNQKKDEILTTMWQDNLIDTNTYRYYYLKPVEIIGNNPLSSPLNYFADIVISEYHKVKKKAHFEETHYLKTSYNQANNLLLDQKYHSISSDYAAIALDKDGFISMAIGGRSYYQSPFNIAYHGKRDIGSTIKPLVYYEALKCGIKASTTLISEPITIDGYTYKNYHNKYYQRNIDMKYALATSDNIYALKILQGIGPRTLTNRLNRFNIDSSESINIALGSVSMSLRKLSEIYLTINNNGYYQSIYALKSYSNGKKLLYKRKIKQKKMLDSKLCQELKELMQGMFDPAVSPNGTGLSIRKVVPANTCGKSGLTDYDSYMIGFTDNSLAATWVGYLENQPLKEAYLQALPKHMFGAIIS